MKKLKEIFYFCNSGTRIVVTKLIDNTRMKEDNHAEHFDSYSKTVPLKGTDGQKWNGRKTMFRVAEEYRAKEEEQDAKREAKRLARAQKAKLDNYKDTE
ncbi:hypothetical protein B9Z55_015555 [Caenorhabditis nigoni]|uniref:Uncharacterized protein n=1 Tax=Caenorhabditis nigoni TaxID=1611254 RepID=A0A2G5UAR3_9PELO|nr:hypothetical protein B9Z55_015555 [Caenorhabditis nigoni]